MTGSARAGIRNRCATKFFSRINLGASWLSIPTRTRYVRSAGMTTLSSAKLTLCAARLLTAAVGLERDHAFRQLRFVRLEFGRIGVGPVRQVHHHPHAARVRCEFRRRGFHDIEPVAVEEVGMLAVHL